MTIDLRDYAIIDGLDQNYGHLIYSVVFSLSFFLLLLGVERSFFAINRIKKKPNTNNGLIRKLSPLQKWAIELQQSDVNLSLV
jgi:hypothetical protein